MRRLPLVLAVLSVVAGLGILIGVVFTGHAAPAKVASGQSPAGPGAAPDAASLSESPSPSAKPAAQPSSPPAVKSTTRYVFPVIGNASYAHSHHDYPASDIISACGNPVVSPVNGVVLEVNLVDTWTAKANLGATRGGLGWSVLGDDGVRYYGSHLSAIEPAIRAGVRVTAGTRLGKVGRTGDTTACHLHFGISPVCKRTGDWWIRRGVIWPWSYLDAWKKGTAKSPVADIKSWQAQHGCPTKPLVDP